MRAAAAHREEIFGRLRGRECVLLLDFDGTLAPIVADHRRARITPAARAALRALSRRIPVAVISGRALADVRRRVGLPGISYAGSHGLEARIAHGAARRPLPAPPIPVRSFGRVKRALGRIARRFPLVRIEDKGASYALHYRRLTSAERIEFLGLVHRALESYIRAKDVRAIDDLATYDIMPDIGRTKGHCARDMLRTLGGRSALPVYIGEGRTDEDAFSMLRHGITIRVGRREGSAAHYYFSSRDEVDVFLREMLRVC